MRANSRAAGRVERDDAALGGGIGGLADLALIGRDRGGRDDDAALAVGQRLRASIMSAAASRIRLKLPIRLMSMTRLKWSSGMRPVAADDALRPGPMPAQLISMRAGAVRGCAPWRRPPRRSWRRRRRSRRRGRRSPRRSAAAASALMSSTATLAPAAASARAVAAPRPEAPPVTSAACPPSFIASPPRMVRRRIADRRGAQRDQTRGKGSRALIAAAGGGAARAPRELAPRAARRRSRRPRSALAPTQVQRSVTSAKTR